METEDDEAPGNAASRAQADTNVSDGGDQGPAPLQHGEEAHETFSGLQDNSTRSGSILEGAINGSYSLDKAANSIAEAINAPQTLDPDTGQIHLSIPTLPIVNRANTSDVIRL